MKGFGEDHVMAIWLGLVGMASCLILVGAMLSERDKEITRRACLSAGNTPSACAVLK